MLASVCTEIVGDEVALLLHVEVGQDAAGLRVVAVGALPDVAAAQRQQHAMQQHAVAELVLPHVHHLMDEEQLAAVAFAGKIVMVLGRHEVQAAARRHRRVLVLQAEW